MSLQRKQKLWACCEALLREQLNRLKTSMDQAQREANLETKSSAGDKYETNRSMMQLEKERYAIQHTRVQELYTKLSRIQVGRACIEVETGALVHTSKGWFYVSVGLGEVECEHQLYRCLSIKTPMGQILEGCEEGDIIEFRGKEIEIFDVF